MKLLKRKKIGIYGKPSNQLAAAIYEGASALNFAPFFRNPGPFGYDQFEDFDYVVAIGLVDKGRLIRDAYNSVKQVPVFIADAGYILRDQGYYQFGLNDLNWLPETAEPDRAENMGLVVDAKRKTAGEYILVCGQKPGDSQHDIDVDKWQVETTRKLRELTDKEIIFRPHPKVKSIKPSLGKQLKNAFAVVTYNSTAAYEAILKGVPVFCDPCAAYASLCDTDLAGIETPKSRAKFTRQKLFDRLAYAQWTLEELTTPEPLRLLIDKGNFWMQAAKKQKRQESSEDQPGEQINAV